MNKKKVSVVMAGAMLASSVAPVLAATPEYEVNGSNKGILIRDLRNLLTSKVFANVVDNKTYAGTSVYEVRIDGNTFYDVSESGEHGIRAMEEKIQTVATGTKIVVLDRGHVEKNGKFYAYTLEAGVQTTTFTEKDFTKIEKEFKDDVNAARAKYAAIYGVSYDSKEKTLTVETRKAASQNELTKLTFKVGDTAVDFTKPVDVDKEVITNNDWSKLEGFAVKSKNIKPGTKLDEKELANITVSDVDAKHNVVLSDLYDGLLLTEKGQTLLNKVKEANADGNDGLYVSIHPIKTEKNGIYTFDIEFVEANNTTGKYVKQILTISSNNKNQLDIFHTWMERGKASVEVLAGDNRYETAVKVAKENANIKTVAENGNIVLVNGNALVDGLAAAPLAASVINKGFTSNNGDGGNWDGKQFNYSAPILLTEAGSLPKATKDYMKELVAAQRVGNLDKVTVYLVGGTTVLNRSLETQLKDLGLRVVRAGGDNREETSLKVAEVMKKDGNADLSNAFVVGANGEADAMSIASVAAEKKQPIIVESNNGLSEDAIDALNGWKNETSNETKSATIIGGEAVVSKATEEALKAEKLVVDRIAGTNRQKTNAAVIDRFAAGTSAGYIDKIVLSKDGQNNKSELIDALTATSLAVKHHSPIVLATNNLSNEQANAIEKKATRNGVYVYQVGHGVSRDVLKQLAERVGLAK